MTVAFFGHRDTPDSIKPLLEDTVNRLIIDNEDINFLVGTHGAFDRMTQGILKKMKDRYPRISCHIILAYLPTEKGEEYPLPTIYPEGIERTPKRFAISYRNNYMVSECDLVVCYIQNSFGGAAQFAVKARKKGKKILNLGSLKI